jgi:hypothetical protein
MSDRIEVDYDAMLTAARNEAEMWREQKDRLAERLEALEHYTASLVAALEWYTIDDHYRGHDPEILYDVGCIARKALDGDSS